jgi:hypothetical protein
LLVMILWSSITGTYLAFMHKKLQILEQFGDFLIATGFRQNFRLFSIEMAGRPVLRNGRRERNR